MSTVEDIIKRYRDVTDELLTVARSCSAGWDQAVDTNQALNRENAEATDLLRCAREQLPAESPLYQRIDAWLNRGW